MPTYPAYIRDNSGALDTPAWRPIGVSGITEVISPDVTEASNGLPIGGTSGQFLRKMSVTDYDAQWATPPSTAGTPQVPLTFPLDSGSIISGQYYPDYSVLGLANNDRVFLLSLASPYTTATWKKYVVMLTNVQTTPDSTTTIQLYSLTAAAVIFTVDLSGAPDGTYHTLTTTTTSPTTSTSTDGNLLQLRITAAPAGNQYGGFIVATYEMS